MTENTAHFYSPIPDRSTRSSGWGNDPHAKQRPLSKAVEPPPIEASSVLEILFRQERLAITSPAGHYLTWNADPTKDVRKAHLASTPQALVAHFANRIAVEAGSIVDIVTTVTKHDATKNIGRPPEGVTRDFVIIGQEVSGVSKGPYGIVTDDHAENPRIKHNHLETGRAYKTCEEAQHFCDTQGPNIATPPYKSLTNSAEPLLRPHVFSVGVRETRSQERKVKTPVRLYVWNPARTLAKHDFCC